VKGFFWEWSLSALLLYFAPVYIGAFRRWRDRHASWPVWKLLLVVVFTGWTYIGWLWALRMAFKDISLPSLPTASSGGTGGGGGGGGRTPTAAPVVDEKHVCPNCTNGTNYCTWCAGRGTWWEGSNLLHCQTCLSSGRITCANCGGTGLVG
jgi:hypothetical protein